MCRGLYTTNANNRRALSEKPGTIHIEPVVSEKLVRGSEWRRVLPVIPLQMLLAPLLGWLERDVIAFLREENRTHERTLRAAARTGHLRVQFLSRSAFGRPIRRATRAAGHAFMRTYFRHFEGHGPARALLPIVPHDYYTRLRRLRQQLRVSQAGLAARIGAAGRAVVYQWESRKRKPSPVLWQRVLQLEGRAPAR